MKSMRVISNNIVENRSVSIYTHLHRTRKAVFCKCQNYTLTWCVRACVCVCICMCFFIWMCVPCAPFNRKQSQRKKISTISLQFVVFGIDFSKILLLDRSYCMHIYEHRVYTWSRLPYASHPFHIHLSLWYRNDEELEWYTHTQTALILATQKTRYLPLILVGCGTSGIMCNRNEINSIICIHTYDWISGSFIGQYNFRYIFDKWKTLCLYWFSHM